MPDFPPEHIDSQTPAHVVELARVASGAVIIEPALLRRLRRDVVPELDAGAEFDLWFSPLVATASSAALTLRADIAEVLRAQLAASPVGARVRAIVDEVHAGHPGLLRLEEEVAWAAACGDEEAVAAGLRRAVATWRARPSGGTDVLRWFRQARRRLPAVATRVAAALELEALAAIYLDHHVGALVGVAGFPEGVVRLAPATETVSLVLELTTEGLAVEPLLPAARSTAVVEVPRTDPPLIEVRWVDGEERSQTLVADATPGRVVDLPGYGDALDLRTLDGRRFRLQVDRRSEVRVGVPGIDPGSPRADELRQWAATVEPRLALGVAVVLHFGLISFRAQPDVLLVLPGVDAGPLESAYRSRLETAGRRGAYGALVHDVDDLDEAVGRAAHAPGALYATDTVPRLYVSSTALDLRAFRDAAVHVGQRLGFEVVGMEVFGPDPHATAALCREKVESADLFVGMYAHRYGYVPDGLDGMGIIELEYDWARARDVPILAFLIDESVPWPPGLVERGASWDRLQAFKDRLRRNHIVATLTTPEQLRDDLFVHLPKLLSQVSPLPPPEQALPRPPEPYVAHPYTLLQTTKVVGREPELARLDQWLSSGSVRVLCMVAIGGMGKSALTWRWFQQRAATAELSGRLWWSFYETDATFDRFVIAALAYCAGRSLAEVMELPGLDREQQLLAALDREPFLLVLDGLERLLIAYSTFDLAHLSDDDLDRKTANAVADRPDMPEGFVGQHRLRTSIDPRVGNFLRKLVGIRTGRVLVTTRLFPSELQTVTGHELPGVEAWFLTGLEPDDAVMLWRELGVSGDDAQLRALFARIDHYPLLIRALAGEVARYRPAPGDWGRWLRDHPGFDPFVLPLVQAKSHVLAHAIGGLGADAREVLQTMAAFRAPVTYSTLRAMIGEGREWSERRLDVQLAELEERGLLGWDRAKNTYDLHPIVRGVVWSGLDDVRRRALYGALEEHFDAVPGSSGERSLSPDEAGG